MAALVAYAVACLTQFLVVGLLLLMGSVGGGLQHMGIRWWAPWLYAGALCLTGIAFRQTLARWKRKQSSDGFGRDRFADAIGPAAIAAASMLVGVRALWRLCGIESPAWLVAEWQF